MIRPGKLWRLTPNSQHDTRAMEQIMMTPRIASEMKIIRVKHWFFNDLMTSRENERMIKEACSVALNQPVSCVREGVSELLERLAIVTAENERLKAAVNKT